MVARYLPEQGGWPQAARRDLPRLPQGRDAAEGIRHLEDRRRADCPDRGDRMSAAPVFPVPPPTRQISAGWTRLEIVPDPPAASTWEDRHCPDCALLEPHHTTRCIWRD